jgi:SAM-dependent methyltransferase
MRNHPTDAFGAAMRQYQKDGSAKEVIERSDGYISSNDLGKYFDHYSNWNRLDQSIIARASGKILDIGCGAGRHSLYLQEQGFDVLGIDSSPGCVSVASKQGVSNTQTLAIENLLQVHNPPFDSVLLLGANLGLLGSISKGRRILKSLASITSPAARIIGTTNDYSRTTDPRHIAYHQYNRNRSRLPGTVTIRVRWCEYISEWFDYVLFTKEDLQVILHGTSWELSDTLQTTTGIQCGYILQKTGYA